jgi:hypothetical protein
VKRTLEKAARQRLEEGVVLAVGGKTMAMSSRAT